MPWTTARPLRISFRNAQRNLIIIFLCVWLPFGSRLLFRRPRRGSPYAAQSGGDCLTLRFSRLFECFVFGWVFQMCFLSSSRNVFSPGTVGFCHISSDEMFSFMIRFSIFIFQLKRVVALSSFSFFRAHRF